MYNALAELRDEVVFVGGAAVSLYADREVQEPRPTDDIDVIVEVVSYNERAALDEKLRARGFINDVDSGIVCRYNIHGLTVDILPTNDPSIGFNNRWYEEGFKASEQFKIDDRHIIRILPAPYFIATKLEAFNDRGRGDGRTSQDFEDIVFLLEQRSSLFMEMEGSDEELKDYLKTEFTKLMVNKQIYEWIDSHVERGRTRATQRILDAITSFIQ